MDGQNVGLVVAAQLLDLPATPPAGDDLAVVLLSDSIGAYGLVVESFRGEQDLVVRPLDPRLGKVPNLSAAAILDDGSPVLIVDVEDLIRSMDQFIQTGSLARCDTRQAAAATRRSASWSWTIRLPSARWSGNCFCTRGTRWPLPWTAWTAGTRSAPRSSICW